MAMNALTKPGHGYRNHPALARFKASKTPRESLAMYMLFIWQEGQVREYKFDRSRISCSTLGDFIPVTTGQLEYERRWLLEKLKGRAPIRCGLLRRNELPDVNQAFHIVSGKIEPWERVK